MPFQKQILNGIHYLLNHRNNDGGIPSISPRTHSGFWTTAEAVDVFLNIPYFPKELLNDVKDLITFLVDNHVDKKGWPISVGSEEISTMATGHAITALSHGERIFRNDVSFAEKCKKIRDEAFEWLDQNINDNEGWGIEPEYGGGGEAKETRVISTHYALKAYFSTKKNFNNSQDVKQAINYVIGSRNNDGGWGLQRGMESDPGSTARSIIMLIQSKRCNQRDPIIKKALSYLLSLKDSWSFDVESYLTPGSPGQVHFHSNTQMDVLEALIVCEYYEVEVYNLIHFFLNDFANLVF